VAVTHRSHRWRGAAEKAQGLAYTGRMERLRDLGTIALLNLAALGVIVWRLRDPRSAAVRVLPPATPTGAAAATAVVLRVYVSGAVAKPGVVVLPDGARIDDAVRAAGGFRDADMAAINLAAPLADGVQVNVPALGQAEGSTANGTVSGSGGVTSAPFAGGPSGSAGAAAGGKVNVNRATVTELQALPGIGPALAQRIVDYRTASGPFASVDDLGSVSGIGDKTLERLRPLVAVR
jgi:competence protein ComEA